MTRPFRLNPIKHAILARGLKQAFVAEESGLSENRLSRIVTGRAQALEKELRSLARVLGVSWEELTL